MIVTSLQKDYGHYIKNILLWTVLKSFFPSIWMVVKNSSLTGGDLQSLDWTRSCFFFKKIKRLETFFNFSILSRHLLVQGLLWKRQSNMSNFFKVTNKDIRTKHLVHFNVILAFGFTTNLIRLIKVWSHDYVCLWVFLKSSGSTVESLRLFWTVEFH